MSALFKAGVQYDDWTGTAAADDADKRAIRKLLKERGLVSDDDFLIGVELYCAENIGGVAKTPSIHALTIEAPDYESAKELIGSKTHLGYVRRIEIDDVTIEQFVGLFKRFSISLSWQKLDLTGREYDPI
ncbi:MAG: hypothetical protein Kilf2KO_28450 [Rhodospirillales bacterium]